MTAKTFRFRIIMTITMAAKSVRVRIVSAPTIISVSMRAMSLLVMVTSRRNTKDAFHWHRDLSSGVSVSNCSGSGNRVSYLYNSVSRQLVSINVNSAISWLSRNSN